MVGVIWPSYLFGTVTQLPLPVSGTSLGAGSGFVAWFQNLRIPYDPNQESGPIPASWNQVLALYPSSSNHILVSELPNPLL